MRLTAALSQSWHILGQTFLVNMQHPFGHSELGKYANDQSIFHLVLQKNLRLMLRIFGEFQFCVV